MNDTGAHIFPEIFGTLMENYTLLIMTSRFLPPESMTLVVNDVNLIVKNVNNATMSTIIDYPCLKLNT